VRVDSSGDIRWARQFVYDGLPKNLSGEFPLVSSYSLVTTGFGFYACSAGILRVNDDGDLVTAVYRDGVGAGRHLRRAGGYDSRTYRDHLFVI
jgi:hypothetical protein